ncbi:MAG: Ig-like domain-containing protein [Betaproteobacteria bacterium]
MLLASGEVLAGRDDPVVWLTDPGRGERLFVAPAIISVEAKAKAARGRRIVRVEFFADGRSIGRKTSAPYEITWSKVAAGHYKLRAKAVDNLGDSDWSKTVVVHVHKNHEPWVRLIKPDHGDRFSAPAEIKLQAIAVDRDHNLARVEFYANQQPVGEASRRPWHFTWTNVAAGDYVLQAKAIDKLGASRLSRPVSITVVGDLPPPPPPPPSTQAYYFIHVDHLNTPRMITKQGQAVWRWDQTEPFGANLPDEDPDGDSVALEFPLRFPGQYADKETNLHYNVFRDYDSGIGRYMQSDPIGLMAGLNTYTYVNNNPLALTDPLGLDATVCLYPGAGGFGHVGIGINNKKSTVGFYPQDDDSGNAITGTPGEVKADEKEAVSCKTIATTPSQDKKMLNFIKGASQGPVTDYTLASNNCVNFVRQVLNQAGVESPDTIKPKPFFRGLKGN